MSASSWQPRVVVPLVTPMDTDGRVDLESLGRLVDFVIERGADGVLALGSSGECVALRADQRVAVARAAIEAARGRVHVMLGVPAWGDADAVTEAAALAELGPDALLVSAPAGMRLSSGELDRHFRSIAAVGLPVVAYDVPARVTVGLEPDLIRNLAADGAISALKDSSGDIVKARRFADATRDIDSFARVTGCEEVIDGSLLVGYHGAVPGLANVFPEWHVALVCAAHDGRWADAAEIQREIVELLDLYFHPIEGGGFLAQFFATVKEALRQLGVVSASTTSSVFAQPDAGIAAHAARILERADALRGTQTTPSR